MVDYYIQELLSRGYEINDPWDIVDLFEERLAKYAGSKYAVCLDSCSNAIFLSLLYNDIVDRTVVLPKHTYASVAMQCIHAGNKIKFVDQSWHGFYQIQGTNIIDSATRFRKKMYVPNSLFCLSFHHRKTLKIGRGGAILTDDKKFVDWCRPMIFDGRHKKVLHEVDNYECIGYHMYMTPEDAAKGLLLFEDVKDINPDTGSSAEYKDLSKQEVFYPYIDHE